MGRAVRHRIWLLLHRRASIGSSFSGRLYLQHLAAKHGAVDCLDHSHRFVLWNIDKGIIVKEMDPSQFARLNTCFFAY